MSWWHTLRNEPVTVRIALPADRAQVGALLSGTWRRHGGQALDDQATPLQSGLSTIAFVQQEAVGFLGLTARASAASPPEVGSIARLSGSTERLEVWADVSLVAIDADRPIDRTIASLLKQAIPALRAAGCTGVACLTALSWLRNGLIEAGFAEVDQVVSYAHDDPLRQPNAEGAKAAEVAQSHRDAARLRMASIHDVDTILALNAAAFAPFWRYGDASIMSWLLTAERAMVAYLQDEPVGFALTSHTTATNFVHLTRVAVHPKAQGRGVGRQLVADALHHAYEMGAPGLALNTQASNAISRRLYESLGFRPVDPVMSVLVYEL